MRSCASRPSVGLSQVYRSSLVCSGPATTSLLANWIWLQFTVSLLEVPVYLPVHVRLPRPSRQYFLLQLLAAQLITSPSDGSSGVVGRFWVASAYQTASLVS